MVGGEAAETEAQDSEGCISGGSTQVTLCGSGSRWAFDQSPCQAAKGHRGACTYLATVRVVKLPSLEGGLFMPLALKATACGKVVGVVL